MFFTLISHRRLTLPRTGNHHLAPVGSYLSRAHRPQTKPAHTPTCVFRGVSVVEGCRAAVSVCRAQDSPCAARAQTASPVQRRVHSHLCDGSHAPNRHPRLMLHRSTGLLVSSPSVGHESPSVLGPTQGVCTQARHAFDRQSGVAGVQQGHLQGGATGKTKRPLPARCCRSSSSSCVCALVRDNPPAGPHTQEWCVDADGGVKMDVTWE